MNDTQNERLCESIDPDICMAPGADARIMARLERKLPE